MRYRWVVASALLVTLITATEVSAQPPPPPPNPSDDSLHASRDAVVAQAAEVGRLSTLAAELDRQAAAVRGELDARREVAFQALMRVEEARAAADEARRRAEAAEAATAAAATAIGAARARLDDFLAATYQQALDLGPLGLLTGASSPDDLIARAQLGHAVAQDQQSALDALELARVDRANAESAARAARNEARSRQAGAEQAAAAAEDAVGLAEAALAEQEARLRTLDAERAEVERKLDALRTADAALRDQRARYVSYQEQVAADAAARRRAAQAVHVGSGGGADIDRALAQLGPQYQCRRNTRGLGPTKPWVTEAGQLLRCLFGIRSMGGVGPRPNPSDHPAGLALDFMVTDQGTGDALAACALENWDRLSVKYVIFRQRINTGSGWRWMEDRGSPVANHMEHVHISFRASPSGMTAPVRC